MGRYSLTKIDYGQIASGVIQTQAEASLIVGATDPAAMLNGDMLRFYLPTWAKNCTLRFQGGRTCHFIVHNVGGHQHGKGTLAGPVHSHGVGSLAGSQPNHNHTSVTGSKNINHRHGLASHVHDYEPGLESTLQTAAASPADSEYADPSHNHDIPNGGNDPVTVAGNTSDDGGGALTGDMAVFGAEWTFYAHALTVTINGVDRTAALLGLLGPPWSEFGDGTYTHVLYTDGTGDLAIFSWLSPGWNEIRFGEPEAAHVGRVTVGVRAW